MTAPSALHYLSIAEASRRIATGRLSPVDLVKAMLARIRALDHRLNSFVLVLEGEAMRQARLAERAIRAGRRIGPLHGIPIALKDVYDTKGVRTAAQSRLLVDRVPDRDAAVVRRLRQAGAIILGKLTTHEFAIGGPSFDLPWPPARNPWNPDYFTGGSSTGAGAAVAAGFIPGALGSDTGGSIRMPAAYCGIAGLKPTYGLVSRAGVVPLAYSLDHCGPMAWTAEDCAYLLEAIAGFDADDPASARRRRLSFVRSLKGDIAGMRIGVVRQFYESDLEATQEARAAIEAALKVLRRLGATLVEITLPKLREWDACCLLISYAESYALHEHDLRTRPFAYGKIARERLLAGALIGAGDYVKALRQRRSLSEGYVAALAEADALVTACAIEPPSPLADMVSWPSMRPRARMAVTPFNVSGAPALSLCAGFGTDGLPLSLQIAAKPFDDAIVLRLGHAYERATDWRGTRPRL
ncbi:MAG: amidase [Proteobacteria bacterium]|nr:amidase [Pseudomonadota bacterium]MBI3499704.1 amidase [Pseudomonadota bacterium]